MLAVLPPRGPGSGGSRVSRGGTGPGRAGCLCERRAPGELRHDLDGVPDLDEHVERGRLLLVPFDSLPATKPSVRPSAELPVLAAMSADGARGRVPRPADVRQRERPSAGPGAAGGARALRAFDRQVLPQRTRSRCCARTTAACSATQPWPNWPVSIGWPVASCRRFTCPPIRGPTWRWPVRWTHSAPPTS